MDDLLYCVKLRDASEHFDLAAEMLAALDLEFSSWEDLENRQVIHTVYTQDPVAGAEALKRIRAAVEEWREYGVEIVEIEPFEIRREDWAEVWKKYFDLIPISERLIIKPSWLKCDPLPGQKVLEIDPGMSFGTGQHATTSFCLKMVDKLSTDPEVRCLLDAGCGSGILAIAGALLGYDPVDAFDYDPDAVNIAAENLARNHISGVEPEIADAATYQGRPEQYDLVCANILGHLLKAYRHNIAGWVRHGGYLALAGILSTEFDSLSKAFCEIGFEEVEREMLREWTSGLFRKRRHPSSF